MTTPFYMELTKQSRLEEMYEIFRKQSEPTGKEIAIRLARFAEAHTFNTADRYIDKLKAEITELKKAAAITTPRKCIRRVIMVPCPNCLGIGYLATEHGHQSCEECGGTGGVEKWITEIVNDD